MNLIQFAKTVSSSELHKIITNLVGFGTRHTLSDIKSETRGIGAARRYVQKRFAAIAGECNNCLTIAMPSDMVTGPRIPNPVEIVNVMAIQRGTNDPNRVVIIAAHLDSRVSDVMDATSDAPGANDDGSGVAAVIEAARILSQGTFPATIVYAVLSGEEQGLFGGKLLTKTAQTEKWQVEADLNNDIIGNSSKQNGFKDNPYVRVFSRESESDTASRNIARKMADLAKTSNLDLDVKLIARTDRFGRGGDQLPMLEAGFPAVRITEAVENYDRQHQNVRTENGVEYGDTIAGIDFDYLQKVTTLNIVTLADLAGAPAPPGNVVATGAVMPDATISWSPVPDAVEYRVYLRETTADRWSRTPAAPSHQALPVIIPDATIDDYIFGVSALNADGYESPVATAQPSAK